jgi:hypothetical protein
MRNQGIQEMPMVIMLMQANGKRMTNAHNKSNISHMSKKLT